VGGGVINLKSKFGGDAFNIETLPCLCLPNYILQLGPKVMQHSFHVSSNGKTKISAAH
jgi:hypothetical protein